MAPMAIENPPSSKRTSSTAEFETSVAKRRNLGLLQHHKPIWDSNSSRRFDAPCQDGEVLQSLLTRSIGLALDAVGFEAAEPVAMESFRAEVEECMGSLVLRLDASGVLALTLARYDPLLSNGAPIYALLPAHTTHPSRLPPQPPCASTVIDIADPTS